jgi:hypothetical protein
MVDVTDAGLRLARMHSALDQICPQGLVLERGDAAISVSLRTRKPDRACRVAALLAMTVVAVQVPGSTSSRTTIPSSPGFAAG